MQVLPRIAFVAIFSVVNFITTHCQIVEQEQETPHLEIPTSRYPNSAASMPAVDDARKWKGPHVQ